MADIQEVIGELNTILDGETNRLQKQQNSSVWTQQICTIIIQSIYGLLFYLFSTTPGYYGDESSCIQLRKYSYFLGVATLGLVLIHMERQIYIYQIVVDFFLARSFQKNQDIQRRQLR